MASVRFILTGSCALVSGTRVIGSTSSSSAIVVLPQEAVWPAEVFLPPEAVLFMVG